MSRIPQRSGLAATHAFTPSPSTSHNPTPRTHQSINNQSMSQSLNQSANPPEDKSAAIADYVQKRNAAKAAAEAIRKERMLEAERKKHNLAHKQPNHSHSQSTNQSTNQPVNQSNHQPRIAASPPRSGIVTGAHSDSSSESSLNGSRRGSSHHFGDQSINQSISQPINHTNNDEHDHDHESDEDQETLNRFAKPTSSKSSSGRSLPFSMQNPSSHQSSSHSINQLPNRSASQPAPNSSLVESLIARVAELEDTVATMNAQQRIFLSFMETTQQQLSMMRSGNQSINQSTRSSNPESSPERVRRTGELQRMNTAKQQEDKQRMFDHVDNDHQSINQSVNQSHNHSQSQPRISLSNKGKPIATRAPTRMAEPPRQWDDDTEVAHNDEHSKPVSTRQPMRAVHTRAPSQTAHHSHSHSHAGHVDQYEDEDHHSQSRSAPVRPPPHNAAPRSRAPAQSPPQQHQAPIKKPAQQSPPPAATQSPPPSMYDDPPEVEDDPYAGLETYPCPTCGRKFIESVLDKHIAKALCQPKKRKVFDVRKQRLEEVAAELAQTQKGSGSTRTKKEEKKDPNKPAKWKIERARLQEAMRAGKEISQAIKEGRPLSEIPVAVSSIPDDRVECPHCSRKFQSQSADRHIPHCKTSQTRIKATASGAKSLNATAPMRRR